MQRVYDFLKEAKVYYLATMDGDQARVRPFGTINLYDGKLYIMTKNRKHVSDQMKANPKVELTAMRGDDWVRITCEAHLDTRHEAVVSMVEAHPHLAPFYRADDPDVEVFYLAKAQATIFSSTPEPLTIAW
ncbi:MAG: pyridoxamine 5'-phosphate oxidase family protein [Bacteroidaceae bacterium]|nr:pyridoxamine 5'-phosphate oxidase family protein [Bacteroidaceae bacterium]